MACALCGADSATRSVSVCEACDDSLNRPVESTGVDWSKEAVAAATRAVRSGAQGEMVCSFCARPRSEVQKLLAGNDGAFICDGCVDLCRKILDSER